MTTSLPSVSPTTCSGANDKLQYEQSYGLCLQVDAHQLAPILQNFHRFIDDVINDSLYRQNIVDNCGDVAQKERERLDGLLWVLLYSVLVRDDTL